VAVTPNGKYAVSGAFDQSIKIFDLEGKQQVHEFKGIHKSRFLSLNILSPFIEEIRTIAISPDGKYIISGSYDRSIKILDFETKQQVHCFENAHDGNIMKVLISSDGRLLVSCAEDKSVKMFDLQSRQEMYTLKDICSSYSSKIVSKLLNRLK